MKSARDNEMPQLNIFRRIKNVVEQIKCCFTLQIGEESGQNVLHSKAAPFTCPIIFNKDFVKFLGSGKV